MVWSKPRRGKPVSASRTSPRVSYVTKSKASACENIYELVFLFVVLPGTFSDENMASCNLLSFYVYEVKVAK